MSLNYQSERLPEEVFEATVLLAWHNVPCDIARGASKLGQVPGAEGRAGRGMGDETEDVPLNCPTEPRLSTGGTMHRREPLLLYVWATSLPTSTRTPRLPEE